MMNFDFVEEENLPPAKIVVAGVGGCGGNAINSMTKVGLAGVTFIAVNTDSQALANSTAHQKIQIGTTVTRGLGAGADPIRGKEAAKEDKDQIEAALRGADMVFLTAGMGGGTGTGAAPIVAEVARSLGSLTVAFVTTPLVAEGKARSRHAQQGLAELREKVDTMIVISNERLVQEVSQDTLFLDAFGRGNDILRQGIQSITDLITVPGIINLDFADVKTVMHDTGRALMGIGVGSGTNRASSAAHQAVTCPLLEDSDIHGATGVIVNITGGRDLTMFETNEAVKVVQNYAHDDANIIFGTVVGAEPSNEVKVIVIATGFDAKDAFGRVSRVAKSISGPNLELFNAHNIDEPAFLRHTPDGDDDWLQRARDEGMLQENLDIPTFLRRRRKEK